MEDGGLASHERMFASCYDENASVGEWAARWDAVWERSWEVASRS